MSILKSILKEEEKRLKSLSKLYREELKKLPKGSISIKNIRNGQYAYRAYRNGEKVRFDYLGKASSEVVQKIGTQIQERRKVESLMNQVAEKLREVQGMISGRKA
jgi:hypothetical protein